MNKPVWWGPYKIIVTIFSLFSCFLIFADPIFGIIFLIVGLLLWASQQRREKNWTEERRHQETLQAMHMQRNFNPDFNPHPVNRPKNKP